MTVIDVSVIIPTFQRRDSLAGVLAALADQSFDLHRYEVVVSIDGSTDGTEAYLRQLAFPYALRWTAGPNAGSGVARNRGAALASGAVLVFMDDDILPTPSLLEEHMALHASNSDWVALGQVQLLPGLKLSPWDHYLHLRLETHYHKMNRPDYRPDFWDCLSGNFSLRRELFERSQGFCNSFAACKHEDIEYGYRLAQGGAHFVYRPSALGYHCFEKGVEAGLRDAFQTGASAVRFAQRYKELRPRLLDAYWQRYPAAYRRFLLAILATPQRRRQLSTWGRWLLAMADRVTIPWICRLPLFRFAYHSYFWLGVCHEVGPAGLAAVF